LARVSLAVSQRVPALVAGAVTCAAVAAGCGTHHGAAAAPVPTSPATSPTTTAAPDAAALPSPAPITARSATGIEVNGTGYRFRAPKDWRDVTSALSGNAGVDRAAGARRAEHGFNSNVNVVVTRGALTPSQVVTVTRHIRDRIRPSAPSYAVLPPVLIAGEPAGHLAGLRSGAKPPYWLEQYVLSHGTHAYVVSFSFSPRVPAAQRRATTASVLASWRWR
jgi:hypothetical protein